MRCSTAHAIPRLWQMGPYFLEPAAPGRAGQGKKFFSADHSKNTRRLLLAEHCWCWFSRSRELATGRPLALALVGNSRRSARREAAAEHKEHGVEHGVISGGEQARTHELPSSRDRHLQLEPKIFGLRRRASEQAGTRASDPRRFRAAAREQQIAPAAPHGKFLRPPADAARVLLYNRSNLCFSTYWFVNERNKGEKREQQEAEKTTQRREERGREKWQ